MEDQFAAYLLLLDDVYACVKQLTDLAGRKTEAVRRDDVEALNQVMREEQALSLAIRGLEQKRGEHLEGLGLAGVSLQDLAARFPPALCMQAQETAQRLRDQYRVYRSAAEVARNTLECNLHEIQKLLAETAGGPEGGPGYLPAEAQPPNAMKTDFRA